MSDIAIQVEHLSKRYRIGLGEEQHDTLTGLFMSWLKAPAANYRRLRKLSKFKENGEAEDVVWALRDVSFEVKQGEVVGIIGHNGAGKSTLLKILSQITEPTSGRALIKGHVASLLEVGTGFHPELTGRENVYLNGTVLGMSKKEVDRKFDEIVDFSGVERFIDTPVKRYSSGMQVRLAFAVAAHLDPEILLIDEVLAVGDAAFQKKCLGKMEDVAQGGRTILFVSHNMAAIPILCERTMLLAAGKKIAEGPSEEVVRVYLDQLDAYEGIPPSARDDRRGTGKVRVEEIWIENSKGHRIDFIQTGKDLTLVFRYRCPALPIPPRAVLKFMVHDVNGLDLAMCSSGFTRDDIVFEKEGLIRCTLPKLPLARGKYSISHIVGVPGEYFDDVKHSLVFYVTPGDFFGSGVSYASPPSFYISQRWESVILYEQ